MRLRFFLLVGFLSVLPATAAGQSSLAAADSALAREIFEQLVEIPSVSATPEARRAAEAMAERLRGAGFPAEDVQVTGPPDQEWNLVARYRGTGSGGPPILLMAHLDVVPALRDDWSTDPFTLTEVDGWWHARGATDNKTGAATLVTNFVRWRREGFAPDRDLVIVLTGDEETTSDGIEWVIANHPWARDAAYALNTDAGGGVLVEGRETLFGVQASEKIYLNVRLEVTNPGGHSSRPRPDNAITQLAQGLIRLAELRFPVELNDVTRGFFERSAEAESGPLAADLRAIVATPSDPAAAERLSAESPFYNAMLRTTCVATRLEAGHADNALPQTARALVNCRILPGGSPEAVEAAIREALADERIAITRLNVPTPSPPSPLTPEILEPIERIATEMWPGVLVVPTMTTGATDGAYVRNAGIPVYGVHGIFGDPDDARAHGRDERVEPRRFYEVVEFWDRMIRALTTGTSGS